jgi:NAD(P)H-dependent flavin oxidoreductase YrpB (nitropropane dioxygenase family)
MVAAPLFSISAPEPVVAQCNSGIAAAIPALNARDAAGRRLTQNGDALDLDRQFQADPHASAALLCGQADLTPFQHKTGLRSCGYTGSPFIATDVANALADYKNTVLQSGVEHIMYFTQFTGVRGNYLSGSVHNAGVDSVNLPQAVAPSMKFATGSSKLKAWKRSGGRGRGSVP